MGQAAIQRAPYGRTRVSPVRSVFLLWVSLYVWPLVTFGSAYAQSSATAPQWRAGPLVQYEFLEGDQPDWYIYSVQVRRKTAPFTAILEGLRVSRFDRTDYGAALDTYATLWHGAYGNVRVQIVPEASVVPVVDAMGELFQSVARVWEVSAGYRRLWFPEDRINVFFGSAARYVGNWYFRGRATLIPHDGERDLSFAGIARRYFAASDDYIEAVGGLGREVITSGAGTRIDVRDVAFGAVRLQHTIREPFSLTLGANYTHDEVFARWGIVAGAFVSW